MAKKMNRNYIDEDRDRLFEILDEIKGEIAVLQTEVKREIAILQTEVSLIKKVVVDTRAVVVCDFLINFVTFWSDGASCFCEFHKPKQCYNR